MLALPPLTIALACPVALYLATALVWRERTHRALVMATHERDLAPAARSFGIEVLGV
jgi:hypothetical protein